MKRLISFPLFFLLCMLLVSCSGQLPNNDLISNKKDIYLVSGIYQSAIYTNHYVYISFINDHGKEFLVEADLLSDIPYEFDDGATYEIIYSKKDESFESVRYTDITKIKLAEYDLSIINDEADGIKQ